MSKFKTVCGVIAFVLFFLMLGAVGAIEQDIVPLFPGMVRVFALMALVGPVLQPGRRVRLYRTGKEEAA